jgi:hypothetical protein
MAKVVGLSGAQGAGKSTVLKGLAVRGWTVDEFRVSRAVQAALGWSTLEDATSDPERMVTFQEEVFRQKLERDTYLGESCGSGAPYLVLTERTFADVAAYTAQWTWRLVDKGWDIREAHPWLALYLDRCRAAQRFCYEAVILLPYMDVVEWQHDPARASRWTVDAVYGDIDSFVNSPLFLTQAKMTVTEPSVDGRVAQINHFLEKL